MKKVNIGLNEATHTQAKIIAVLKNKKLNDYLREAVEEAVQRDKKILKKLSE